MVRQNLSTNASRTREVEEQAVTGLLVNRPSDAPALLAQVDRLNATTLDQDVYQQNASQAVAQLNQMDSELGRVHDALTRVRELVVQASGDVVSAEQRGYIALEVESLRTTVLQAANSNFAGRYLFAGTAWDTAPFDDFGDGSNVDATLDGLDAFMQRFDGVIGFDGNRFLSEDRAGVDLFGGDVHRATGDLHAIRERIGDAVPTRK